MKLSKGVMASLRVFLYKPKMTSAAKKKSSEMELIEAVFLHFPNFDAQKKLNRLLSYLSDFYHFVLVFFAPSIVSSIRQRLI